MDDYNWDEIFDQDGEFIDDEKDPFGIEKDEDKEDDEPIPEHG